MGRVNIFNFTPSPNYTGTAVVVNTRSYRKSPLTFESVR